jgi:hypothetical protein
MTKQENVKLLVEEYRAILGSAVKESAGVVEYNSDKVEKLLVRHADWSPSAAEHLLSLSKEYGSFMLRNALALSIVLGVEDGNQGF